MAPRRSGWLVKDFDQGESYYADAKTLVRLARREYDERRKLKLGLSGNVKKSDLNSGRIAASYLNQFHPGMQVFDSKSRRRESRTFNISTPEGMKRAERYKNRLNNVYENVVVEQEGGVGSMTIRISGYD